ncbi:GNAT family N-acetyltransferase [Aureimonas populi]|uniref:GNAT family N-acetyltransferase n=1 Tax=Aureimonas populi TaxID=1701758 RepID=A0ABW5CPF2_9HYPH|nr:GNAT family N-acetyltransferase [Aureimonas populi]
MKTIAAEVRYATPNDAAPLSQAYEAAWRGAYTGILPRRSLSAMITRRGPDWWRKAIERRSAVLVLEFGDEIAGYATLGRNRTPALLAGGEIYELYLKPEFQGSGLGRHLFEAARQLLASRGLHGLAVWALEENERAVEFYRALGGTDIAAGTERFEDVILRKIAFLWPNVR